MKNKSNNPKQQQLKQKLETVKSIPELKQIYKTMEQQNTTLRQDILSLKQKVDLLLQKQKTKNSNVSPDHTAKEKELHVFQKELRDQHKIMQELKKRKTQSQSQIATDQLNEQQTLIVNKLKTLENQLAKAKTELLDLKNQSQNLQKATALQDEIQKRNKPKITEYSGQNYQLRKKILSMRKLENQKEYESAKIMNSMYTVKSKYHKNVQLEQQIETKKLSTLKDMKTKSNTQIIDEELLSKEVVELKKEVHRKEEELNKSQIQALRKKQQLILSTKETTSEYKQLEQKKTRLELQLNKYKKRLEKYFQLKTNKHIKQFTSISTQITQYSSKQTSLRRQFAGILGGKVKFDDRIALKDNTFSYMIGFIVYQLENTATSKNALVALRAIYDDAEASSNNPVPIPGHFLSKCKMSKYMLTEGDFIKLFKIKYQSVESRILKLQIRTNKNSKYELGDKRSFNDLNVGQNVYGFDISIQQYPVSLFGYYNYAQSQWYMQSLGVEISDLPNS